LTLNKEEKVYIPKDDTLRAEIIRLHHNMPVEIWRAVENSRDGYLKLLVARSNKESETLCGRM